MKKIDTWLDIQRFVSGASEIPLIPRESDEFTQVQGKLSESEIAEVRGMVALARDDEAGRNVRRGLFANHTI